MLKWSCLTYTIIQYTIIQLVNTENKHPTSDQYENYRMLSISTEITGRLPTDFFFT